MEFPLLTLPPELIEVILEWVESPADVLSLSRTCSLLRDLAIPEHLHYRCIEVEDTTGELALWAHLAHRPHLARNVRILRIGRLPRRAPPGAPDAHAEPVDGDAVAAAWATRRRDDMSDQMQEFKAQAMLAAALRNMTGLVSFFWDGKERAWYSHDDWVWNALRMARAPLRVVVAGITTRNVVFDHDGCTLLADTSLHDLDPSHLTRLTIRCGLDMRESVNGTRLRSFLNRCTSLRALELLYGYRAFGRADLSSVFAGLHLPALRRLVLDNVGAGPDAVRDFIVAHPALETLHICAAHNFDTSAVPEGALPNLISYAPNSTHLLLLAAAANGSPPLEEVVLSARQLDQFGPWQKPLEDLQSTVKRIGLWDPYSQTNDTPIKEGLPGFVVERAARNPWYYDDIGEP